MHAGRTDDAIECCRRLFPAASADPESLRLCAWVFSNGGAHAAAAAAYRRLIALCPEWTEGLRHLSGSLAVLRHLDEAIGYATTACERAPDRPEFALHAAALLLDAGYPDRAAPLAERAAALAGDDPDTAADAAELLMRANRLNEAAELLHRAAAVNGAPRLLRVLSAAEMTRGRTEPALAAIERALAAAPDNAEYHVHRGHLLWQLGDISGAAREFERAAALDPAGADAKRAQMALYAAAGLLREATAAGGELLHRFPDDKGSAEAVLQLLNQRLDTIDGEYVVLGSDAYRGARPSRSRPGLPQRFRTQRRVIRALMLRETRTRFADFRLGYGWALLEPVLHIALLSVTFAVLMHGQPPIGRHFFIFYYTGLIPYLMLVHTSSGMSHAVIANAPLLRLPPVTPFDVIAARGLLELVTDVIVAAILLAGFAAIGAANLPEDPWRPSMALLATAALGCGLGFVNAVMTVLWRSWEKAYEQLMRALYFISGIFYVPGMMPDWAREALSGTR